MKNYEMLKTMITLALAFLVSFYFFRYQWLIYAAVAMLLSSLIGGSIPYIIASAWKAIALFMGKINSRIILYTVFYLFLTPLAILYRFFNKQSLNHFNNGCRVTLFEDVNKCCDKELFRKMW